METLRYRVEIKSLVLSALLGVLLMLCVAAASINNLTDWEYKTVITSIVVDHPHPPANKIYVDEETKAGWELFSAQLLDWREDRSGSKAFLVFRREKAKGNPEK